MTFVSVDSGHLEGVTDGVNDEAEQGMRRVCGQPHRNTSWVDRVERVEEQAHTLRDEIQQRNQELSKLRNVQWNHFEEICRSRCT